GGVPALVHVAQPVALDGGADQAAKDRRDHERRPESDPAADLVGEVRPEHENARVREIEHAHHAPDEREPAREHEQEQPVDYAVEERDQRQLEHGTLFPVAARARRRPLPSRQGARGGCERQLGRSILQTVGSRVASASILTSVMKPTPVSSTSYLTL